MAMTLRLPAALDEQLGELVRVTNRSKQDVVREAVAEYVERHSRFLEAQIDRFMAEDAELLRRLAQ